MAPESPREARGSAVLPDAGSILSRAVACHQAGLLSEAEEAYRQVLAVQPRHFDSLHLLGLVHFQRGAHAEALSRIDRAIAVKPGVSAAHNSRAAVLNSLGRFVEAIEACDRAIALDPRNAEAFCNRGHALNDLKRWEEALASCEKAIALKPQLAEAFNNRGNALKDLGRFDEALASYDQAIALKPDYADAFNNCANALIGLKRFNEALECCARALALRQDLATAYYNRGIALHELNRPAEALTSYDQAIALKPDYAEALSNRLTVLIDLCDWTHFAADCARLRAVADTGKPAALPFHLLARVDAPDVQLACARRFIEERYPPASAPLWHGERYVHRRIRLAYLSFDFGDHPVSLLAAGMFERHDRSRFETVAISSGPDSPAAIRTRVKAAFDHFIDVGALDDRDVARLIREREIDVLVDLNGLTQGGRPGILAHRPAPVQVSYLGYAGTLGGPYWDYILADRVVIPEKSRRHFAEQVVYLPDTFMVTDAARAVSRRIPTRTEAGLPEQGLVFCCFNQPSKFTPDVFDVWMRLLSRIEGSVLWLAAANAVVAENLRREAQTRGVAPDRLIFAAKVRLNEDHLARISLADLALDTMPYNSHATAVDALWAGVPVLTCCGATFASRVAGSLLAAAGLPELNTGSLAEYETLAFRLAQDPALLSSLKERLARARALSRLFDTSRFTHHIEAAYTAMWERFQRGEPPAGFAVDPIGLAAGQQP